MSWTKDIPRICTKHDLAGKQVYADDKHPPEKTKTGMYTLIVYVLEDGKRSQKEILVTRKNIDDIIELHSITNEKESQVYFTFDESQYGEVIPYETEEAESKG